MNTHLNTCTCTLENTHMHMNIHSYTHTCTYTHTLTHAHLKTHPDSMQSSDHPVNEEETETEAARSGGWMEVDVTAEKIQQQQVWSKE